MANFIILKIWWYPLDGVASFVYTCPPISSTTLSASHLPTRHVCRSSKADVKKYSNTYISFRLISAFRYPIWKKKWRLSSLLLTISISFKFIRVLWNYSPKHFIQVAPWLHFRCIRFPVDMKGKMFFHLHVDANLGIKSLVFKLWRKK